MPMGIIMREIGLTIRHMVKGFINIRMDLGMKVDGLKTCSMVLVKKSGQMKLATRGSISTGKRKDVESSFGTMAQFMTGSLETIKLKDTEHTLGRIKDSLLENGLIIRCMEEGSLHGKMGKDMRVFSIFSQIIKLGSYVEDKKEGFGVFEWPNKTRYEGNWKEGK